MRLRAITENYDDLEDESTEVHSEPVILQLWNSGDYDDVARDLAQKANELYGMVLDVDYDEPDMAQITVHRNQIDQLEEILNQIVRTEKSVDWHFS